MAFGPPGEYKRQGSLKRILTALDREEKGRPPIQSPPNVHHGDLSIEGEQRPEFNRAATAPTPTFRAIPTSLLPTTDKLAAFRILTGIDTTPAFSTWEYFQRSGTNLGIYTRVVRAEQRAGFEYRLFAILINCCLGLQIIIAASLTALGAGNGPRALVTAFGAVNTVIAGFLTYLKGSGLPNRKKYYHDEWTKVRQYIEQKEREFCLENCELDVDEEVAKINRIYEDVTQEIEANTPDNYASVRDTRNRREQLSSLSRDEPPLSSKDQQRDKATNASAVKSGMA